MRAAAGVAACSLALVGFAIAGTHFGSPATPQTQAGVTAIARIEPAVKPSNRRQIDANLTQSAADEFRVIVTQSGINGAHLYARQCLMELAARQTKAMLDYCVAFDDQATAWENKPRGREQGSRRYFAAAQRYGRYASTARELTPGPVREAMMADVRFFAEAHD